MPDYIVQGARRDSGEDVVRRVSAPTSSEAAKIVTASGILVSKVLDTESAPTPHAPPPPPSPIPDMSLTAADIKSELRLPSLYAEAYVVASGFRAVGVLSAFTAVLGLLIFFAGSGPNSARGLVAFASGFSTAAFCFAVSALLGILREIALNTRPETIQKS